MDDPSVMIEKITNKYDGMGRNGRSEVFSRGIGKFATIEVNVGGVKGLNSYPNLHEKATIKKRKNAAF